MDQKEKIKFMIGSLQVALDELEYAEKYKMLYNNKRHREELSGQHDFSFYSEYRTPNGTLIREALRNVSRLAPIVAKDIIVGNSCNYENEVYKK